MKLNEEKLNVNVRLNEFECNWTNGESAWSARRSILADVVLLIELPYNAVPCEFVGSPEYEVVQRLGEAQVRGVRFSSFEFGPPYLLCPTGDIYPEDIVLAVAREGRPEGVEDYVGLSPQSFDTLSRVLWRKNGWRHVDWTVWLEHERSLSALDSAEKRTYQFKSSERTLEAFVTWRPNEKVFIVALGLAGKAPMFVRRVDLKTLRESPYPAPVDYLYAAARLGAGMEFAETRGFARIS